jgi:hypothetical protein
MGSKAPGSTASALKHVQHAALVQIGRNVHTSTGARWGSESTSATASSGGGALESSHRCQ